MFFARVLLLPRKTSPLYKIGKFRHLLAYIGRFVFPIREPGRLYQNRESPGEIGRLERSVIAVISDGRGVIESDSVRLFIGQSGVNRGKHIIIF